MKLQFKHQKFQADAAKAVCDVFAGQPYLAEGQRFIIEDLGIHILDIARALFGDVARMAATKSRAGSCARACACMSAKLVCVRNCATSVALVAKICFKMSFMLAR